MVDLDLVEEVKHEARIQEEVWKRRVTGKLKSKLRKRKFIAGDLVWRIIGDAQKDHLKGKEPLHNKAYKLEDLTGKIIPKT